MDTLQTSITIDEIKPRMVGNSMVFDIKTNDRGRYQFWDKKKDGSDTKAYEQFKKFGFKKGDTVEIAYSSKPTQGKNPKTGEDVTYDNNTILFFKVDEHGTPQTPQNAPQAHATPTSPQSSTSTPPSSDLIARFDKMASFCKGMDIALKSAEKRIAELENANIDILAEINKINDQLTFIQEGNKLIKPDVTKNPQYQNVFGDDNIPIL